MKLIKDLMIKYKSIIMYLIFGVLTTLVNIVSYYIFSHILKTGVMFSTVIAWVLAVLFAYVTNRKWVFTSYAKGRKEIFNELLSFFSCRIATGIVDTLFMFIFVERLHFNDVIIKIIANIIVIILNYIASKLIIFKKKDNNKSQTNLLIYSAFAVVAFLFLLESPLHIWNGNDAFVDSSVFKTVALMMRNGYTPYLDTFDHKGPVIYLINYLGTFISYYKGVWVFEFIGLFVSMIYFYKIARFKCNKVFSFIITILGVTLLAKFFEGGNYTEEYAMPLITVSLYIFLDYIFNKVISKKRLIVCGISCGLVFLLRPNMVATWAVFCIYIFVKTIMDKDYKKLKEFIIYFLIGFMIGVVPFMIWLAAKGAFGAFIYDYFTFNKMYSTGTLKDTFIDMHSLIFVFINNLLILIPFITIIYLLKDKKEHILYLAYMIISLILICVSGRDYYHYMIIFVPAIIYPFACLFEYLTRGNKNNKITFVFVSYLLLYFILPYWLPVLKTVPYKYDHRDENKISPIVTNISNYIKENTSKKDKISVYGNSNLFYVVSKRMHATKYSFQFPISSVTPKVLNEYFKELSKEQPKIIVLQVRDDRMDKFLEDNNYELVLEEKINDDSSFFVYEKK